MASGITSVPFFRHDLAPANADQVGAVLSTPFLTSGNVGKSVEQKLTEFFDVAGSLLVNSWTNGALTTLLATGIGPGDEVIVPAMTFIASANVVEMVGATPVFVDVAPDTLLMTPDSVSAAITERTRAIMPVHLYGQMCDMLGLRAAIADHDNILIIEDAAHCFEGSRDGYLPGTHGDFAIFSFYATKNITCGEGGAIITRHADMLAPLQQARLHGMTAGAIDRYRDRHYQHWDMVRLGCKSNLPDLLACLLPSQIDKIRGKLPIRHRLAENYRRSFADGPIGMPRQLENATSAEHAFAIHVPHSVRDEAILTLNDAGIGAGVHFRSVPSMTYYRTKYHFGETDFPVSNNWGQGTLSLPLYPSLTVDEQDHVIDVVRRRIYPLCSSAQKMSA